MIKTRDEKRLEYTVYAAGRYISESDVSAIQFKILKALQDYGTLTRYQIMKIIGKPGSTVHENLIKLVQNGLIVDKVKIIEKRGRPTYYFSLAPKIKTADLSKCEKIDDGPGFVAPINGPIYLDSVASTKFAQILKEKEAKQR